MGFEEVRDVLGRYFVLDGFPFVLDLEKSHGSWLVDASTGQEYLDLYTFFASAPLGINPPGVVDDPDFMRLLAGVAANKPANGDLYTTHFADFVRTFHRVFGDPDLPHLFFVEGGALAVENALKCAFDWKSRHNEAHDRSPALGGRVLHLDRAFHGRSGYTMSLTHTDPDKTARFPVFDWPRLEVPAVRFPLERHRTEVEAAERRALEQAEAAFAAHPHDIACFIAEPVQGEGGDNHMRPEFLLAMQELCHSHDALFVLDEVQTGAGATGAAWAYQRLGLQPDVVAFGKKIQVGGVMAGRRVDEVADHVFATSGRISSTWTGGLVDMVRSRRLLEIVERDGLVARADRVGRDFLDRLTRLVERYPHVADNARGLGLMCAFDAPDRHSRDTVITRMREEQQVLVLPSGERSVRVRPALTVTEEELGLALRALESVLATMPTP
ncbi:L-lysine 6-transaminase [Streptomyces sp. SCSIO 30461]|uniref:L-lysine 6-transaminase n=1 Tax=Streptomyces sp. SCSIO 30461 TaxID=3118085 RepID=UPI0030CBDA92